METAKLIVHARGETRQMPLNPEGTLLGRTKPAEVVLDSRMVSRRHARIFRDPVGAHLHPCAPMHDLTVLALTPKPGA